MIDSLKSFRILVNKEENNFLFELITVALYISYAIMSEESNEGDAFTSNDGVNILLSYLEWPSILQEELKAKEWNEV